MDQDRGVATFGSLSLCRRRSRIQPPPNPQPSTLNPESSTLNPQPSTLNPQPSTSPEPLSQFVPSSQKTAIILLGFFSRNARAVLCIADATCSHQRSKQMRRKGHELLAFNDSSPSTSKTRLWADSAPRHQLLVCKRHRPRLPQPPPSFSALFASTLSRTKRLCVGKSMIYSFIILFSNQKP